MKRYSEIVTRAVLAASTVLSSVSGSTAFAQDQNALVASIQQKIQEKESAIGTRKQQIANLEAEAQKVLTDAGIKPDVLAYGGIIGAFGSLAGATRALENTRPDLREFLLDVTKGRTPAPTNVVKTQQLVGRVAPWVVLIAAFSASSIYGSNLRSDIDTHVKNLSEEILSLQRVNEKDAAAVDVLKTVLSK